MASFVFQKSGVDVVDLVLTPSDFDVNGMWHSDSIATSNDTRVTVNVIYSELDPDGSNVNVDYRLQATLEGEEGSGVWLPLVKQLSSTFRSESALTRRLIATNTPTAYDPNVEHIIPDALGNEAIKVTAEDVEIPGSVRMCLQLADRDQGFPGLTSFKLTLRGSKT